MRILDWSTLAAALLVQLPAAAQEPQPSPPPIDESLVPYASTEDSVRLPDGRSLHFVCMGDGSPTVILTTGGGGMAAMSWGRVQPQMAEVTRVCAWDRPGFGLSDGASWKQTVDATTTDLEAALATGKIPGPYVMAGHSLGSYESMMYADRHPEAVVGMVLLDPSFPGQNAVAQRIAPAMAAAPDPGPDPTLLLLTDCAKDIRAGAAKLGGPDPHGCFAYPPNWPQAFREALGAHADNNPLLFESVASSLTSSIESTELAVNPNRNYGDMPLIILSRTDNSAPPGASPEVQEQLALFSEAWSDAHDAMAGLSTRGINARVPGANHGMHLSGKAQVVIDAVEAVVREAREGTVR